MICLIALIVFSVCGIFSVKYRRMAKVAFDCVFKRVTLRKCDTAFDKKIKMKVTTKLHKRNERLGKLVFRHFEAISWLFTIILIVSLAYSVYSVYNLIVFGTCDPVSGECILTPATNECTSINCAGECNSNALTSCDENCDCNAGTCT